MHTFISYAQIMTGL